jgi:hypothetical protein
MIANSSNRILRILRPGYTMKCPSSSILTVLSVARMMSWWLQSATMCPASSFGRSSSFATAFSIRATTTTRTRTGTTIPRRHQFHQSSSRAVSSIIMFRDRDRHRRLSISTSSTVVFSSSRANEPADAFVTEKNSTSSILRNGIPLLIKKHDDRGGGRYGKILQEVGLDHIITPDTDLPSDRTVSTMDVFCNR